MKERGGKEREDEGRGGKGGVERKERKEREGERRREKEREGERKREKEREGVRRREKEGGIRGSSQAAKFVCMEQIVCFMCIVCLTCSSAVHDRPPFSLTTLLARSHSNGFVGYFQSGGLG